MVAVGRIAAEGRLVAEDPAGARRDADRTAAVGAVGQRGHAGRDCSTGAARGAAGGEFQVPRVARDSPERAVRVSCVSHLRRGRARVHDRARVQQALHRRRRDLGHMVDEAPRAEGGDLPLDRMKILDDDRHPFEGARLGAGRVGALRRPRLLQRAVVEGVGVGVGVDLGVHRLGTSDDGRHELDRQKRPGTESLDRLGRGHVAEFVGCHCSLPLSIVRVARARISASGPRQTPIPRRLLPNAARGRLPSNAVVAPATDPPEPQLAGISHVAPFSQVERGSKSLNRQVRWVVPP